jgi:D-xylose transport system substrate-binding protein
VGCLLAVAGVTGCTNADAGGGTSGNRAAVTVGVILPDTTSEARWKTQDPKLLGRAFDEAGVPADIQNANGDPARFLQLADQMIGSGVKVLLITSLDRQSGAEVIRRARAAGVKTVDYDRLTLGGGADYYIGFDNVQAGVLLGQGLVNCLRAKKFTNPVVAELTGGSSDSNANLLKQGYDSVLQPMYDDATYVKGPEQDVTDGVTGEGAAVFEQMLTQQPRIRGVLAANGSLAVGVNEVLQRRRLNGKVAVAGQDTTVEGLRNVLTGDQCMTVYRAIDQEAQVAAKLAIELSRGRLPSPTSLGLPTGTALSQIKDPESGAYLPFVALPALVITRNTMQAVLTHGFVSSSDLCAGELHAKLCRRYGIR